ncbi:MAG: diaminopimelate epimerase [Candidatus Altiarchaeota archaeon]|nr:diaminopimelate epimerase [Candidatus Altiarchaeota archaeon]
MAIPFTKMHGAGNDFIVVDEFNGVLVYEDDKPVFVARYARRHLGVGADGVIFVQPSDKADAKFVFYNPDGSKAEMCGNGIRCFAKYLYERGLVVKEEMEIETFSGIKTLKLHLSDGKVDAVSVDMGVPAIEFVSKYYEINGSKYTITSISTGNPHAIIFVKDVDSVDVRARGREVRNFLEAFPNGANVHFVQKMRDNGFLIRTYERGVEDETLACGTGICASAVAASLNDLAEASKPLIFHAAGGDLTIELKLDFASVKRVFMTGPAEEVYTGVIPFED